MAFVNRNSLAKSDLMKQYHLTVVLKLLFEWIQEVTFQIQVSSDERHFIWRLGISSSIRNNFVEKDDDDEAQDGRGGDQNGTHVVPGLTAIWKLRTKIILSNLIIFYCFLSRFLCAKLAKSWFRMFNGISQDKMQWNLLNVMTLEQRGSDIIN